MISNTERTLKTGTDPRHFAEFSALRNEIGKLHHPARPDVDWARVEQLCLALFRQNGVELQTTVDFTLARTHIAGLAGLCEGLELLAGLISHQWSTLWPPQTHARVELLAWLSDRLQQVWRTMTLCYGDLALVYRAEQALEQLCTQLQTLELKHLSKLDGVRLMLHNAALRLESAEAGAETPDRLIVPIRHAGLSEPQPTFVSATASAPLVYIVNEPAPPSVQVALAPPEPPPPPRWKAGHGFVAGLLLMAVLMAGGFAIWQSLSSDPLREALLANASPLPTLMTAKSINELQKQISDAELGRLAETVLQASGSQLEQLAMLPPLWAQMRGDALLSQAQQLWPASQNVKRLSTLWQQQREAGAAPLVELKHYALAQERLRQLADRLNGLDEKKGRYMTVSELKTVVFAIQQPLAKTLPLEELLRQYQVQSQSGQTPPSALRQQIDSRFAQLLNRYALLTLPEMASQPASRAQK
ncbi:ImpA domain-containing protein [Yersinia enterocolitica]|uniref:VasL domain-containing protein n=1 Tax=Yersinia mollaretii TaxID=33060 RepID=UPI0005E46323|nr:VasL domain-containing protein [Yersinia mollaretii]CNK88414.1 ImpA domain-containing protein [Yersinia enterocolitica]